jgi:hypothetical protein
MGNRKGQNKTNSRRFNHRTEGLLIINAITLTKTLCHQPGLIAINGAVELVLDLVNPLKVDDVVITNRGNKRPSAIMVEGINFLVFLNRRPLARLYI